MEKNEFDVTSWISRQVSPEQMLLDFPAWTEPESGIVKEVVNWIL